MKVSNIKYYRVSHDLTQRELSQKIGVSDQYICDIENGKSPVSDKVAMKLADVFNVSVDEVRSEREV